MSKKQTAVEWLIRHITEDQMVEVKSLKEWVEIFDQAKAMEREQIEDAYWEGGQDVPTHGRQCQQYYNSTYKGGEQ